jgi:hypothetical protein
MTQWNECAFLISSSKIVWLVSESEIYSSVVFRQWVNKSENEMEYASGLVAHSEVYQCIVEVETKLANGEYALAGTGPKRGMLAHCTLALWFFSCLYFRNFVRFPGFTYFSLVASNLNVCLSRSCVFCALILVLNVRSECTEFTPGQCEWTDQSQGCLCRQGHCLRRYALSLSLYSLLHFLLLSFLVCLFCSFVRLLACLLACLFVFVTLLSCV